MGLGVWMGVWGDNFSIYNKSLKQMLVVHPIAFEIRSGE